MSGSVNIVLVDDHVLLRKGLANLLKDIGYGVLFEADNGKNFIEKLKSRYLPEVVLLDINMPEMDGYETASWIKKNHPSIKVLALSMNDDENAIIRMLRCGAKGYLLKDTDPSELKAAIEAVVNKGFYYNEMVTGKLIHAISNADEQESENRKAFNFSEREIEFLKYICTEFTYREIAEKMNVSPRTVDGYREAMFEKLNIKTRVGLAMYTIRNGIVQL